MKWPMWLLPMNVMTVDDDFMAEILGILRCGCWNRMPIIKSWGLFTLKAVKCQVWLQLCPKKWFLTSHIKLSPILFPYTFSAWKNSFGKHANWIPRMSAAFQRFMTHFAKESLNFYLCRWSTEDEKRSKIRHKSV